MISAYLFSRQCRFYKYKDSDRASYPEIVDELAQHGANAKTDSHELFRRMVFNILNSNVDDHVRNHGFLWTGASGWMLSPAYDLNPTPTDLKPRILSTNISLDEGTCSIELVLSQADMFGLTQKGPRTIVSEVGKAVSIRQFVAKRSGLSKVAHNRMSSAFSNIKICRMRSKCSFWMQINSVPLWFSERDNS